ncbi:helix-turn-helix domain-containing protein [Hydrogenophaga sp.]|uniref:helix-turn-helix domain-containing protein n=1 Tax=Hydrogenophaga sp. TaxID=1904254 RepID=UPI0026373C26|nr:helix-turn-helix domain-containing protein [Hydrogenophaga sp.]MCW5652805.1 helix-turn-helix domain-containing protein [Hydrogenophaga sp.]
MDVGEAARFPDRARRWSTDEVDPEGRLDYWVGAICEAFLEMDCSSREAAVFDGHLTSVEAGPLSFNQVEASSQDVYRTGAGIARGQRYPFYLITHRQTPWHVRQGGRHISLRPGDAVLVDSAQRYELHFPVSVEVMSIQLPRAWVGEWLTRVDDPAPRVAFRDQGWGRALSGLSLQFAHEPLLAAQYPEGLLCDQLGAMLAAAIEPGQVPLPGPASRDLLQRAQALQREALGEPGLTAQRVADRLGVSLRTLHRAYAAGATSFAQHLRHLRLAQAAQLLSQARLATVPVAEIGRRCGYVDASHFAREFQRQHGIAPSSWRRRHLPA